MIDYNTIFSRTKDLSVLLVEDYEPLRNDMAEVLDDLFKNVVVASDGEQALKLYQKHLAEYNANFDLLITDIQMPMMNGVELSRRVREIEPSQEIIVFSAHTDTEFLIELINLGISQFLTKPIKQDALIDTIDNVSRKIITNKCKTSDSTILQLGEGFAWDSTKCILLSDGLSVELTKYELILFQLFIERSEQICSHEEILYYFDDYQIEMSEKSIRNLVSKLRKKLPSSFISNIYGLGYKFTLKM